MAISVSSSRWTTSPPHTSQMPDTRGGLSATLKLAPQSEQTRRLASRPSTSVVAISRLITTSR